MCRSYYEQVQARVHNLRTPKQFQNLVWYINCEFLWFIKTLLIDGFWILSFVSELMRAFLGITFVILTENKTLISVVIMWNSQNLQSGIGGGGGGMHSSSQLWHKPEFNFLSKAIAKMYIVEVEFWSIFYLYRFWSNVPSTSLQINPFCFP